jgi:predicted NBD/HSP70 family sugar kinase
MAPATGSESPRNLPQSMLQELVDSYRQTPPQLKALAGFAALLWGLALLWLIAFREFALSSGPLLWAPAMALLLLGFLTFVFVLFRLNSEDRARHQEKLEQTIEKGDEAIKGEILENRNTVREVLRATSRWPEPGLLVGCRIGRQSISCGVLLVEPTPDRLPRASSFRSPVPLRTREVARDARPSEFLAVAAELICDVTRDAQERGALGIVPEAIGVGVPGFVDLAEKRVEKARRPLPGGTLVVEGLAQHIVGRVDATTLFGTANAEEIEARSYLDNDVRCAARHKLSQHLDDSRWSDFVCLHVGSGVGASIVLDHGIFYGSRSWAGEVGHIDLTASRTRRAALSNGTVMKGLPCTCGETKCFHFEALVSYTGLSAIARTTDHQTFERLTEAFRSEGITWTDEALTRKGWPVLIASGATDEELPQAVLTLARNKTVRHYMKSVLHTYTEFVAEGISMLTSVLDVNRIVLFGSLLELQNKYTAFQDALQAAVADRLVQDRPRYWIDVEEAVWRGAALLARDEKFHRIRRGATENASVKTVDLDLSQVDMPLEARAERSTSAV